MKDNCISKAYIASPLGFSETGRHFYDNQLKPVLNSLGLIMIDPWELTDKDKIMAVQDMSFGEEKRLAWEKLNILIGENNTQGLDKADIIIAILDGPDVDSGTASEIGYGAAKGKFIEGYRSDFRLSADNIGSTVNLQVEYFIRHQGGDIAASLYELVDTLKKKYKIV